MKLHPLAGIYVASVTPLSKDDALDTESILKLMKFYADRGCHGALLQGTTGEGTSLSVEERVVFWNEAIKIKDQVPDFRLLAATGTPSLPESIALTKEAFSAGMDAVVVLPPYYFRNASSRGLSNWYSSLIKQAVPKGKYLFGYHIPQVSGVGLPFELLEELNRRFPHRFAGLKDSSGDLQNARNLVKLLPGKAVLVGNDRLLGPALSSGTSGAITALANLRSPLLREIWEAHHSGENTDQLQAELTRSREVLDSNPVAQSFLKALLHSLHAFPKWPVRAPLLSFDDEKAANVTKLYEESLN